MEKLPEGGLDVKNRIATKPPYSPPWRRDLGSTFAARKIEMASLAIQTTSQQSLFSDKRMGAFSAVGNHPSLEFDHTPKDTPPTLPSFKKGERKTVQFSDQNEVYEIDSLDTAYLSDVGSPLEEQDEIFSTVDNEKWIGGMLDHNEIENGSRLTHESKVMYDPADISLLTEHNHSIMPITLVANSTLLAIDSLTKHKGKMMKNSLVESLKQDISQESPLTVPNPPIALLNSNEEEKLQYIVHESADHDGKNAINSHEQAPPLDRQDLSPQKGINDISTLSDISSSAPPTSEILYEQTVNSPHTTPNLQESIDEETDTVDSVDTVDAVDTVDSVDAVDAVDAVDSVDSVDSVDAVDAVDTILRNTLTLNTFTRDSASHGNDYGDSDSMSSVSSPSITSFEETESLCSRDSTWESSSQTTQIPSTELVYGFDDKLLVELDRITETITKENEIQTDRLKGPSSYDHLSLIYTASGKLKNKQTQGQNTLVLCDDDLSDATSAVKEWKDSSMGLRLFSQKSNRTISRASALPVDAVSLGRLYIKILTAEDLDVPITKESPKLRCVVNDGAKEYATDYCAMKHTIQFKQEFYIDLNSLSDFTLTLQTEENVLEKTSKRFWGQNKGTKTDDLERYIHPRNRAIAQTRVSIQSIQSECSATIRSASLVLVNGWYRNVRSNFLSNKPKHPEGTQIREKAIGKIKVQLFFLPGVNSETEDLPNTMKACEQVMNIRRFYHTCWKKGYMYQLGGDVKYWKKQYYKLQGGYLFAYSDSLTTPRSVVDLSKVIALNVKLTPDASEYYSEPQTSIKDLPKDQNNNNIYQSNTYLMDDSRFVVNQSYNSNDRRTHEGLIFSLKNGFQCIFSNGERMEFFCDLSLDHKQWTNILNTIIGRVPIWPIWLSKET